MGVKPEPPWHERARRLARQIKEFNEWSLRQPYRIDVPELDLTAYDLLEAAAESEERRNQDGDGSG